MNRKGHEEDAFPVSHRLPTVEAEHAIVGPTPIQTARARTGGEGGTAKRRATPEACSPPPSPTDPLAIDAAIHGPAPRVLAPRDEAEPGAGAIQPPAPTLEPPLPRDSAWQVADARLLLLASVLDDLEAARIAADNRLRSFATVAGLPPVVPEIATLTTLVEDVRSVEGRVADQLGRAMKVHPLGALVARTKGLGWRQAARLLAVIGDPYWHPVLQTSRGLYQLQAYCGLHVLASDAGGQSTTGIHTTVALGVAPRRARGVRSNWNEDARKRLWLIASTSIKFRCRACTDASRKSAADEDGACWSPPPPDCTCEAQGYELRVVYDATRAHYADAVHAVPCARCGQSGSPAPAGSPLSAAHQHARAIRRVAKHVLKALWREARSLQEGGPR